MILLRIMLLTAILGGLFGCLVYFGSMVYAAWRKVDRKSSRIIQKAEGEDD